MEEVVSLDVPLVEFKPEPISNSPLARWIPCTIPAAGALLATMIAATFSLFIRLPKISITDFTPPIAPQAQIAGDIAGRMTWGSLAFVFVAVATLTLAVAATTVWTCTGQYPQELKKLYRRRSFVSWVVLMLIMVAFHQLRVRGKMLGGFHEGHYGVISHYAQNLTMATFSTISRWLQAVLITVVAAQAFAFASLLFPSDGNLRAPALERRKGEAARMLYVNALFLTVGVLVVYALFDWPTFFFESPVKDEVLLVRQLAIDRIAISLALGNGTFFSVLLATAYLPTSALLDHRLAAPVDVKVVVA